MSLAETLSTPRLRLIRCGPDSLRLLAADPTGFETSTGLRIEPGYLEFPEALGASLEPLQSAGPDAAWWCPWMFVHQRDRAVIGLGGYKGPPSGDGVVEFGYGVAPRYRGAGYATEAARALVTEAFRQAGIQLVCAHTLPGFHASGRVLAKCGLRRAAELYDPVDGPVCRWERGRDDPEPAGLSRNRPPELLSARLRLRPYRSTDFEAFAALNNDAAVRRHVGGPLSGGDVVRRFEHLLEAEAAPGNEAWAITECDSGDYVGHAWLVRRDGATRPELGLLLAPDYWHRGFGTEVARTVLDHALETEGHASVVATVDADHPAAIQMLEHAGMQREGEARDEAGGYLVYGATRAPAAGGNAAGSEPVR